MSADIFDALDVSLREDTYSCLIATALRADPERAKRLLAKYLGVSSEAVVGDVEVRFRRVFPDELESGRKSQDRPDLLVAGTVAGDRRWLVIEAKIGAGEGWDQTRRYADHCDNARAASAIADYRGCFLTVSGRTPSDPRFSPLTFDRLLRDIDGCTVGALTLPSGIAHAWANFRTRVFSLSGVALLDGTRLSDLLNPERPDAAFDLRTTRCDRLARHVFPADWICHGSEFKARARESCLLLGHRPGWVSENSLEPGCGHLPTDCFNVHCEFESPLLHALFLRRASLHLHFETRPYYSEKNLRGFVSTFAFDDFAELKREFRERLRSLLKTLPNHAWRPRTQRDCWSIQLATHRIPISEVTTVAELRDRLRLPLQQIAAAVDPLVQEFLAANSG